MKMKIIFYAYQFMSQVKRVKIFWYRVLFFYYFVTFKKIPIQVPYFFPSSHFPSPTSSDLKRGQDFFYLSIESQIDFKDTWSLENFRIINGHTHHHHFLHDRSHITSKNLIIISHFLSFSSSASDTRKVNNIHLTVGLLNVLNSEFSPK